MYAMISRSVGQLLARTSKSPEWTLFVSITTREIVPSMPKPPIAAWNRSAFDSRLHVRTSPDTSTMSNSRTASPIVPTAKLFLPWMFMPKAPPSVGNIVPDTTRGQNPSGKTCFHSCSMVTPPSHVATPVRSSNASSRFMRVISSTCPRALTLASP